MARMPKQVEKQAEQAAQIQKDLQERNTAPAAPPEPPAAPQETPPQEVAQQKPDDWETKYKVLQGKYNAEIRAVREQMQNMQQEMENLKQPPKEPEPPKTRVTESEVQEYGENFIDMVGRKAEDVADQVRQDLKSELETIRQQNIKMVQARFYNDLSGLAPQWREINQNADFLEWLDQPTSPLSRRTRYADLQEAFAELDADAVSAFFITWSKQTTGASAPPSKREIETPKATAGTNAPAEATKKVWTNREIHQFYNDLRAGVYEGREAEAAQLELDIFAAQSEGRVKRVA